MKKVPSRSMKAADAAGQVGQVGNGADEAFDPPDLPHRRDLLDLSSLYWIVAFFT